jgi:hypothetical protein
MEDMEEELSEEKKCLASALGMDLENAMCKSYIQTCLDSPEPKLATDVHVSGPVMKEIEDMFNKKSWAKKIRKKKDRKNVIKNILYKAEFQSIQKRFKKEYDCLLILPRSRQIVGEFFNKYVFVCLSFRYAC